MVKRNAVEGQTKSAIFLSYTIGIGQEKTYGCPVLVRQADSIRPSAPIPTGHLPQFHFLVLILSFNFRTLANMHEIQYI
jgi:hypothetical protein